MALPHMHRRSRRFQPGIAALASARSAGVVLASAMMACLATPLPAQYNQAARTRRTGLCPGDAPGLEGLRRGRDGVVRPGRRRAPPGPGQFRGDARSHESRDRRRRHRRGGVRRVPRHPGLGRRRPRAVQHSSLSSRHRRGLELPHRGRVGDHQDRARHPPRRHLRARLDASPRVVPGAQGHLRRWDHGAAVGPEHRPDASAARGRSQSSGPTSSVWS